MFGRRIKIFSVFGIPILLDLSWFVVLVLVTWSLAEGFFPQQLPDATPILYWMMGLLGALGLFASVLFHELAHALVARRFEIGMRSITLFLFGGVAEMTDEPPSPKAEFWVAIAGPVASLVLGLAAGGFGIAAGLLSAPRLAVLLGYLALMNVVLAIFNLFPAFPLDGGRILRSALWHWQGDLRSATRVTSKLGSALGLLLIAFGIVLIVTPLGDFTSGLWMCLIGLFVRNAAQMSYQQMLLRHTLEGEPVSRFMKSDPVTVPRAISVAELVEDYVYRHHFKMFPVVDGDRLVGCVTTQEIKELPREDWDRTSVGALAQGCSTGNTITPETDALEALAAMRRAGQSRLMVLEGDQLAGILTLKDLLDFFALRIDLEKG